MGRFGGRRARPLPGRRGRGQGWRARVARYADPRRTRIPAPRSTWRGGRGCRTAERTGRSAGRRSSSASSLRAAAGQPRRWAARDPAGSGRYEATIAIPSGGVGRVEVGLFGESCVEGTCTRSDLLFELPEDQRVPQAAAAPPAVPVATAAEPRAEGRAVTTDATRHGPVCRTCRSPSRSSGPACCCWSWSPSALTRRARTAAEAGRG